MPYRARLLGFAFTNADFLFEVDKNGTILFAAGAANDLVKETGEALIGKPAGKLFKPSEGTKFSTYAKSLKAGDRAGPYKLQLATGSDANVSMFMLPENGAKISCTLTKPGDRTAIAPKTDPRTGLPSRDGFLAATQGASEKDALTLVNVPGLPDLCAQLSPDNAGALMQRIGASLAKSGISAAGQLSDTSFGAVAPATRGGLGLAGAISEAIAAGGLKAPAIAETRIGLAGAGLTPEQRILSVRYVVERFAEKGKLDAHDGDIGGAFAAMMDETLARLAEMTRTVGEGAFELAFQPICLLADGHLLHYEALARFPAGNTADTVKFIEAMGIANVFDLAVANKVLAIAEDTGARIAFNVSGATLASPNSFGMLAAILARKRKLASQILVEITETSAITDLENAGKAISSLRGLGFKVGLDDFGAGATSVNYLHAMPVDFVKFDGALVKKIGASARDDALLSGLAKLCREMCVQPIAECVETEQLAKAALALGFEAAQGRHFGAPLTEIPAVAVAGKRKGVQESWG